MTLQNMDFFIKDINLKKVRFLEQLNIQINDIERTHLILTGKNGSGKTTTLIAIKKLLEKLYNNQFVNLETNKTNIKKLKGNIKTAISNISNIEKRLSDEMQKIDELCKINKDSIDNSQTNVHKRNIESYKNNIESNKVNIANWEDNIVKCKLAIENFSNIEISFSNQQDLYQFTQSGEYIMAFFEAKRQNNPTTPNGINKIDLSKKNSPDVRSLYTLFIQYIVNLRLEMLDAREEGEIEEVNKIEKWFERFENCLKVLFDADDLKLKYDRKNFNYLIQYSNKSFGLNELSDGYSAALSIITELILRMEAHDVRNYNLQGIVLIDEIETHLHVSLQKNILPFLTSFFPKIQFIITTHSPFILSSLPNTVICDLENRSIIKDLSGYSYESLINSYFNVDKYSYEVKKNLESYKQLIIKDEESELSISEEKLLIKLENYFDKIPDFLNEEIKFEINKLTQNSKKFQIKEL